MRKKKAEVLSKFRFSIQFRIALNYMKLFMINSVIIVLLFIFAFIMVCNADYKKEINEIVEGMEQGEITKENHDRVYENSDIRMRVEDLDGNVLYDDIDYKAYNEKNIFNMAYYSKDGENIRFVMFEDREINAKDTYKIQFQMDYSREVDVFVDVMGIMMIIIIFSTHPLLKMLLNGLLKLILMF